jgi:hypothetical protein
MTLPRPGAPHIDNLISTMLLAGNRSRDLNLDLIAHHQKFDAAEFRARFAELEWQFSQLPNQEGGDK